MKQYNVKYERGQEVYILLSKKLISSKIEKIRITEAAPYIDANRVPWEEKDGITIEYLVVVEDREFGENGSHHISYDWFNQDDVFLSKEELIQKIV